MKQQGHNKDKETKRDQELSCSVENTSIEYHIIILDVPLVGMPWISPNMADLLNIARANNGHLNITMMSYMELTGNHIEVPE